MINKRVIRGVDEKNVAVLIDSENISAKNIDLIMKESLRHGLLTIKRIYGDWTDNKLSSWKNILPEYAIQPIQQFRNTTGKNSTDSSLIIDAMDILYSDAVDCFIIISSDSDFTRLATRLRESGKIVIGIGELKTPKSLVNACNEFSYIENIQKKFNEIKENLSSSKGKSDLSKSKESSREESDPFLNLFYEAFNMVDQNKVWKNISKIGHALKKMDPGFDPHTYGASKLSSLLKKYGNYFVTKSDESKRTLLIREKKDDGK